MSIKYANVHQSYLAQGLELLITMIFRQWELRLDTWDNYFFPIMPCSNSLNKCLSFSILAQNWFRSMREELHNCCLHIPVSEVISGKYHKLTNSIRLSSKIHSEGLLIPGIISLSLQLGQKACEILGFRHKCLIIWEVG